MDMKKLERKVGERLNELERIKQEAGKEMGIKVGQFIGALAVHMSMAGGMFDLGSFVDMPLDEILEVCFRNGISFEIKNEHIPKPVFSPTFGYRKEEG